MVVAVPFALAGSGQGSYCPRDGYQKRYDSKTRGMFQCGHCVPSYSRCVEKIEIGTIVV